ncbi:MAG: aldolase/citrate lyase family protein [Anaerovoracaceae bacterium]|nr:aldolase/citrate lyase family protein [Anaerovoracaceae bacterium]
MENKTLEKFRNGEKTLGTFTHLGTVNALEALGYTGLDYVFIDMEHSPLDTEGAELRIKAALHAGLTPFVRVFEQQRTPILKVLDAGAQGVMVPMIKSVDEAKQLVEYAKFTPLGARGLCPTYDGGWGFAENMQGSFEEYMRSRNEETMLILQCETLEALEHIDEIAAVEGVDSIFVGPLDLSNAMGIPGQYTDPGFTDALKRVAAACADHGKMSIMNGGGIEDTLKYFNMGYDSIAIGLDTIIYINAYRTLVDGVKEKL